MIDEVRSSLPPGLITILRIGTTCASNGSIYSSANYTNGEIHDDKEKDKQYDGGNNAF